MWPDERIADLAARGESQFDLLRGDIREMRTEMHEMRAEMRESRAEFQAEMREMRTEMHSEFASVRRDMFHDSIALFAALVAMYATMLVHTLS